jgi:hypothetical protein
MSSKTRVENKQTKQWLKCIFKNIYKVDPVQNNETQSYFSSVSQYIGAQNH